MPDIPNEIQTEGWVDPHMHWRNDRETGDGRMELVEETSRHAYEAFVAIGNCSPPDPFTFSAPTRNG